MIQKMKKFSQEEAVIRELQDRMKKTIIICRVGKGKDEFFKSNARKVLARTRATAQGV